MIATRSPGWMPRAMSPRATAATSSAKVCTVTGTKPVPRDALRSKMVPAGSRASRSCRSQGTDMCGSIRPTPGVLASGRVVLICSPRSALGGWLVELVRSDDGVLEPRASGQLQVAANPAGGPQVRQGGGDVVDVGARELEAHLGEGGSLGDLGLRLHLPQRRQCAAGGVQQGDVRLWGGLAQGSGRGPRRGVHRALAPPAPHLLRGEG